MNYEGIVVDTEDLQQNGRFKVWIPSIDGDTYEINSLPWTLYLTPFGGQVLDHPGSYDKKASGLTSYGFWGIPKIGALCVVSMLYEDPNRRIYVGSYFGDHCNRSLPTGRMRPDISNAPLSDTYEEIEPAYSSLKTQFSNELESSIAKTRGVYERAVAQDKTEKDGSEGYQKSLNDKLDPQTYCLTTPARHSIILQDNPETSRVRIKTSAGTQVILDDANERIYISTSQGRTWFEMDNDGHINVYGESSISVSSAKDINFSAAGNLNINAGKDFNVVANSINLGSCEDINITGGTIKISSDDTFNLFAGGDVLQTGSSIHLNGPTAQKASCPEVDMIVPTHEPFKREESELQRNQFWKE